MKNHRSFPPIRQIEPLFVRDWRYELESLGCHVGEFTTCQYRKPGQWIVLPLVVVYSLPEHFHCLPARIVADWLFNLNKPSEVMGLFRKPFPGHQRLNGACIDLHQRCADTFDVELTPEWVRFYLKPPKDCSRNGREDLDGQIPIAWQVVPRIVERAQQVPTGVR